MAKGALNISRNIILVPDFIELSNEQEERNEQDDRAGEDEASRPSHRSRVGVVVNVIQVKLSSALLVAVSHRSRLKIQRLPWTDRMRLLASVQ